MLNNAQLEAAYRQVRASLLRQRHSAGHWVGRVSSSAFSTATAVSALTMVERHDPTDSVTGRYHDECHEMLLSQIIVNGVQWLADNQNEDGGWGDTDSSRSDLATTMLVVAAFHLTGVPADHAGLLERAQQFIQHEGGMTALRRRHGGDKTFAAPILMNYALANLCPWQSVPALPFERVCLPSRYRRWLRLPVASFAVPALVAVGQARFFRCRPWNPLTRFLRTRAVEPSLAILRDMQPESGGYLEAIPLTSFVVMSLAASGRSDLGIVRDGVRFLIGTAREDGSWPIEANLAMWNTTQSINALGVDDSWDAMKCLPWLLDRQHGEPQAPASDPAGGWGWSDRSGAVPNTDDTAGVLLALAQYRRYRSLSSNDLSEIRQAARRGVDWLRRLQNTDGGWPTFRRQWGRSSFDRSGSDLTAHALRALDAWAELLDESVVRGAIHRGLQFLDRTQNTDGSWTALWFGNQDHANGENPVYGTAKVLMAYRDLRRWEASAARRARLWLKANQNADGGWGGRHREALDGERVVISSVEETAVAVEALLGSATDLELQPVLEKGLSWLVEAVDTGRYSTASPIGLYFAKLWFSEQLFPLTSAAAALRRAAQCHEQQMEFDCTAARV